MIKIDYRFIAKGPMHHGSDINAGTMKLFRRQACLLRNPVVYRSVLTDEDRIKVATQVANAVWRSIDHEDMAGSRRMHIWDEFRSKLQVAARSKTKTEFLEKLCGAWSIRSIHSGETDNLCRALALVSDDELLQTIRDESMMICLTLRAYRDMIRPPKEPNKGLFELDNPELKTPEPEIIEALNIYAVNPASEPVEVVKERDEIPCISGNSIRGRIRRLVMSEFADVCGITNIPKEKYHILFSGGLLDSSTKFDDLDQVKQYIDMCPMLGLFGSAVGNNTIEGDIRVSWAYPLCKERDTGDRSYHEYIDTVYQTRRDSAKTEKNIEFNKEESKANKNPQQMMYQYEVLADGTKFEHTFSCLSPNPLIISAFWRAMEAFKNNPVIGGMASVGNGEIEIHGLDIPDNASNQYMEYLNENAEGIRQFWQ